jgi:hypothetical protein
MKSVRVAVLFICFTSFTHSMALADGFLVCYMLDLKFFIEFRCCFNIHLFVISSFLQS